MPSHSSGSRKASDPGTHMVFGERLVLEGAHCLAIQRDLSDTHSPIADINRKEEENGA